MKSLRDIWKWLIESSPFMATVAVPLTIALVGDHYSEVMKESENRVQYVQIAVAELTAQPTPQTEALRSWAIDVLASQSPVELTSQARTQLMRTALPVALSGNASAVTRASGVLEAK